ncbi:SMI1/KNR4 family protein [Embleya hyalina]|uniref:SMI1/KNR4 family protein n=1 Tax=Embleya hyalina TaxID=516124 RepID=A0A401Z1L9_9ACTN|nr:SMI1/KNR4 family protein [Embleya hyalina]GCE00666.1 hypothetical protein EHYA_08392 [Embleya hyalina]
MSETLARLSRILGSPPENMLDTLEWSDLELQIGTRLPVDYKILVSAYPRLCLADFIRLLDPRKSIPGLRPLEANAWNSEWLADMREDFPEEFPYPAFPEPEGVLMWANTTDGDYCYWQVIGEPEEWEVVISTDKGRFWSRFPGGVIDFLEALEIRPETLPQPLRHFPRPSSEVYCKID